jgi:3-deoxy-D-manno-octulosonic-acid transferase
MIHFLYNVLIKLYGALIYLASFFNTKAKKFITGRHNWKQKLTDIYKNNTSPVVWFHVSSLGEFEQGRPVIELLKKSYPKVNILLTFFSPSGYEIRKEYPYANAVCYLPLDTPQNARFFITTVKPVLAVFVKYDFWYNYLIEISKNRIPIVYISVLIRKKHYLNYPFATWFIRVLKQIQAIFVQDHYSLQWFNQKGFNEVYLTSDTRFDRVVQIVNNRTSIKLIEDFLNQHPAYKVLVAGSTWLLDDELISSVFQNSLMNNFILIVAPHEIAEHRIKEVERLYKQLNPVRYSKLNVNKSNRCLIIDNIGMLSSLYFYADYCYVGGGFNKTVHNTQEPAAYGKPVFFGPNYKRFNEAVALVNTQGGFSIKTPNEMINKLIELNNNPSIYQKSCEAAKQVIYSNIGSSKIIVNYLLNILQRNNGA